MNKTALVITSISPPNAVLKAYAAGCQQHSIDYIVVGDVTSPTCFTLDHCDYWGIERQRKCSFALAKVLPERHYARKNLGYLIAMSRGAEIIVETDDDNFPYENFWCERKAERNVRLVENDGWVNVYKFFTKAQIWPRGFPLEFIHAETTIDTGVEQVVVSPIQQGLADLNPDVDAIYRLVMPLPHSFLPKGAVALGKRCWSPFNSQNTTWFKKAFPLLYLPSYCSFRMCDIWRSFVASRICWENDWPVMFHSSTVYQERNEHNLLKDFKDEVVGYVNNARICEELGNLGLNEGEENIGSNLKACYELLVNMRLIHENEMALIDAWLEGLYQCGIKV